MSLLRQVFDKHGRGFIGVSDLRAVLHCLGERLTDEESKETPDLLIRPHI